MRTICINELLWLLFYLCKYSLCCSKLPSQWSNNNLLSLSFFSSLISRFMIIDCYLINTYFHLPFFLPLSSSFHWVNSIIIFEKKKELCVGRRDFFFNSCLLFSFLCYWTIWKRVVIFIYFESYQLKIRLPLLHTHVYSCKRLVDVNGTRFFLYWGTLLCLFGVWMWMGRCGCIYWFFWMCFLLCAIVLRWWLNSIQWNKIQASSVKLNVIFAWLSAWKWERKKCWNFGSQLIDKLRFFSNFCSALCIELHVSPTSRQRPSNIWLGQFSYLIISNLIHLHFPRFFQIHWTNLEPLFATVSLAATFFFSSSIFQMVWNWKIKF